MPGIAAVWGFWAGSKGCEIGGGAENSDGGDEV